MRDKPVGYSPLHDFLATATPEQLKAKCFNMADKQIELAERLKEKNDRIAELEQQVQKFYTHSVVEISEIQVPGISRERRAKLDSGEESWTVFEQSIYQGIFRIMRRKLQTRTATSDNCQWLAVTLAHHVYRTLEKFNLVAKEK